MTYKNLARHAAIVPALLLAGALGACSDLLEVQNPGAVADERLTELENASLLVPTVVSDFQRMYDDIARAGAWFTDELVTGHNFVGYREWDGRVMNEERTELRGVYTEIHQARFSADSLAGRYKQLFPNPTPVQQLDIALMRAYGGYNYIILGEYFCESPVRPDEGALPSDELTRLAIPRFEEAIQLATAARTGTGAVPAARADSIINLSHVGLARAYLQLGEMANAIEHARQVPADFEFWAFYSEAKDFTENIFQSSTTGANMNLGVDVKFRNLNDTRVLHTPTSRTGHNGATPLFRPYQAPSFSGWVPGDTVPFQKNTNIRFSSGLEARYILAEAGGMSDAELLAFVNERRAVGGQPLLTEVPAGGLQAEVRDQRRRDFFMDGHRLGDLRRYLELYGIDEFPQGTHPDIFIGTYGTATCFIPALDEKQGNPAY